MRLRKIVDWLTVNDYARAKRKAASSVAARYTRGNVHVQNGWFLDEEGLDRLSKSGNDAAASLRKMVARQ